MVEAEASSLKSPSRKILESLDKLALAQTPRVKGYMSIVSTTQHLALGMDKGYVEAILQFFHFIIAS